MSLRHSYGIALGLFVLAACGGSAQTDADGNLSPSSDAGGDAALDTDSDAVLDADGPGLDDADNPDAEVEEDEDDPGFGYPDCTDVSIPPEPPSIECDVFAPRESSGCWSGQACTLYVIDAHVDCGQASYGTKCESAGSGKQGSSCQDRSDCIHGFICRVSGAGRQCTKLCQLDTIGSCEDGLVCLPFDDIPGFGGCM